VGKDKIYQERKTKKNTKETPNPNAAEKNKNSLLYLGAEMIDGLVIQNE
jgi:hypothetical protein